jgi:hypothetical protein
MKRTEQKERLSDLIEFIKNSISGIENCRDDFDEMVSDYETLYNKLENEGYDYILEDDVEVFANKLLRKMIEGNADIEMLESELDSFKSELDDYAYELSESKQEKLEEKYSGWEEDVTDKISSLQNDDEFGFDEAIDMLYEIIEALKQFKK